MKHDDPGLLKLAEYNKKVVERFDIIEEPKENIEDQYFVVFGHEEVEAFNPANIRGMWGAGTVSVMMAKFRQSGVLSIPSNHIHPAYGLHVRDYENIQPLWAYVLKVETLMYRQSRFEYEDVLKENTSEAHT